MWSRKPYLPFVKAGHLRRYEEFPKQGLKEFHILKNLHSLVVEENLKRERLTQIFC